MQTPDSTLSPQELQRQRELIRRGLVRSNTAAMVILLVVIGLAIGAVIEAFRADRYARRLVTLFLRQSSTTPGRKRNFGSPIWRKRARDA